MFNPKHTFYIVPSDQRTITLLIDLILVLHNGPAGKEQKLGDDAISLQLLFVANRFCIVIFQSFVCIYINA